MADPLTAVITSPCARPAEAAGVFGYTWQMKAPFAVAPEEPEPPPGEPPPGEPNPDEPGQVSPLAAALMPMKPSSPRWTVALACPSMILLAIARALSIGMANPVVAGDCWLWA